MLASVHVFIIERGRIFRGPICPVAGCALFVACCYFARKHEALRNSTPAMANGLSDYVWAIKEVIERAAEA
jgi:hypothetical protein